MLSPLRKFSSSIYAKIFLGIVIIPFVFWGMGSSFTSGNKNVVVVIDKEKHSTQDFVNFVKNFTSQNQLEWLHRSSHRNTYKSGVWRYPTVFHNCLEVSCVYSARQLCNFRA